MEKTTVASCLKIKDWTSKEGQTKPIYEVRLSNGTTGESFAQEIPVGTPIDQLKVEDTQYGKKIKWIKPNDNGGFKAKQRGSNEAFAMAYAKDLAVAGKIALDQMSAYAEMMFNWMESKKK